MFIVDLNCPESHRFEGWYDSAQDYFERAKANAITCPVCGKSDIHRLPSSLGIKRAQLPSALWPKTQKTITATPEPHIPLEMQKALAKILQRIRKTHQDVGDAFADRALSMSRHEEPEALIMGQSTPEQEHLLDEEGVPYFKIPIPDIEKN